MRDFRSLNHLVVGLGQTLPRSQLQLSSSSNHYFQTIQSLSYWFFMMQDDSVAGELDALIVGSGFAGCWLLYHLRKLGYKVNIYEAAPSISGIWYWNCYPGSSGSESSLYERS